MDDKLNDECGIFGIFAPEENVARLTYGDNYEEVIKEAISRHYYEKSCTHTDTAQIEGVSEPLNKPFDFRQDKIERNKIEYPTFDFKKDAIDRRYLEVDCEEECVSQDEKMAQYR